MHDVMSLLFYLIDLHFLSGFCHLFQLSHDVAILANHDWVHLSFSSHVSNKAQAGGSEGDLQL